jgi:16S rRNA (adenine1518-N6/adenine1519-N6)-dimethyltransferase
MSARPPFGQHFLADPNIVRVAIRMAELAASDVALEVGPGLGVLTTALADSCMHVQAVEIDTRLAEPLEAALAGRANVTITWGDALQIDLAALRPAPTALVSNLPYAVATPLVVESLAGLPGVGRWCVMVQREVADRFFAAPSTPDYGAVSVLVQLASRRTGFHPVSRTVFRPPPNVDSALVAFTRRDDWGELAPAWPALKRLVQGAFTHRRKTLANSLQLAGVATREVAEAALAGTGAPPGVRAEALEPPQFVALAAALADRGRKVH